MSFQTIYFHNILITFYWFLWNPRVEVLMKPKRPLRILRGRWKQCLAHPPSPKWNNSSFYFAPRWNIIFLFNNPPTQIKHNLFVFAHSLVNRPTRWSLLFILGFWYWSSYPRYKEISIVLCYLISWVIYMHSNIQAHKFPPISKSYNRFHLNLFHLKDTV